MLSRGPIKKGHRAITPVTLLCQLSATVTASSISDAANTRNPELLSTGPVADQVVDALLSRLPSEPDDARHLLWRCTCTKHGSVALMG